MEDIFHNVFRWIIDHHNSCRFDFTASGMPSLDLNKYGIELEKREFLSHADKIEKSFKETVAGLYGIDANQIIPTAGGSEAIQVASLYLRRNSSRIVVPVPEYEPVYRVPSTYGFPLRIDSDLQGMNLEKDESISMSSPNNPTGLDIKERMPWFMDSNNLAFADETFREFTFPEKPETLLGKRENLITAVTMTKFYGIGPFRSGWIMGEKNAMKEINEYRFLSTGSSNILSLYFTTKVLEKRDMIRKDVMSMVSSNRSTLNAWLKKTGFKHADTNNASFTYIYTDGRFDAADLLKKRSVLVVPGEYFMAEPGFRLCYLLPHDKFVHGLEELEEYFGEA